MNTDVPYYQKDDIAIYHADSIDFLRAMPDACVDMIFTDPPYGNNNQNGDLAASRIGVKGARQRAAQPIANDDACSTMGVVSYFFSALPRILKDGAAVCCCCCGGGPNVNFADWILWLQKILTFKQAVVWDKRATQGIGLGIHYRRSYEFVLVAHKGKQCNWYEIDNLAENVIRDKFDRDRDHPNSKPIGLIARFLDYHSATGDEIFDPFMGGGSTLVAAKLMGRKATGVEIEERWCELAAKKLDRCLDEYEITNV